MRVQLLLRVALVATGLPTCACRDAPDDTDTADSRILAFDTATVRLLTAQRPVPLTVEVAVTDEQRSLGLMERRRLADSAGMLFVFRETQPPSSGFWMYRTRIPLDIAFLDSTGRVRAVRTMAPCTAGIPQGCPTYTPDVAYRYALEVNAGLLARHGIGPGSVVQLPPSIPGVDDSGR